MQVFTHTTAPHKGALRHPIPRLPQATNITAQAKAPKKSPSGLRTRVCVINQVPAASAAARPSSMAPNPSVLAEMGITKDDYDIIAGFLRADAAANGGVARTARVIDAMRVTDYTASVAAIRFVANLETITLGVGAGKGASGGTRPGAGRPPNSRDRSPRAKPDARADRSDRGRIRVSVTPAQAAAAYDETGTSPEGRSLRRAADRLGISHETVKKLVLEHRQSLTSDGESK